MRIKSRKQLITEYNEEYGNVPLNDVERMNWYLESLGPKKEKIIEKAKNKAIKIMDVREYESIHIILYEYPMKTDRGRHLGGRVWSPNAAANKNYLKQAIQKIKKDLKLINTPAQLTVRGYLPMPAGIKPDEQILYEMRVLQVITKPDNDNIEKCYMDMLSEVIIVDDDIFHKTTLSKHYSWLPRVELEIKYQKCHESEYVYNKIRKRKMMAELIEDGLVEVRLM